MQMEKEIIDELAEKCAQEVWIDQNDFTVIKALSKEDFEYFREKVYALNPLIDWYVTPTHLVDPKLRRTREMQEDEAKMYKDMILERGIWGNDWGKPTT